MGPIHCFIILVAISFFLVFVSKAKEPRVLIWVMTQPNTLETKARAVKETWGKRCDKIIFFSSETNNDFPTVGLSVAEGRKHLTAKVMKAFQYLYENYLDDYDWFMKVDDDTYVIVENLLYFLSNQNPNEPIHFGHHFNSDYGELGFYSGGSGYVLSKEALTRLGKKGKALCRQDGEAEDVYIAECLEKMGVQTHHGLDHMGRYLFICFDLETQMSGNFPDWYYLLDRNGCKKGIGSVSDYAISFHYITPAMMWSMEFLLYHLRRPDSNTQSEQAESHNHDNTEL